MAKFRVKTEGASAAVILLRTVHDVDRYVGRMRVKGDRTILVGDENSSELRPYDEWRSAQTEPRLWGTT